MGPEDGPGRMREDWRLKLGLYVILMLLLMMTILFWVY